MRLAFGPENESFRAELRAFLDAHAPPPDVQTPLTGESYPDWIRDWQATMFDNGWLVPTNPPELGGRNAGPVENLIYMEELAARGIRRSLNFQGMSIVAPSLLEIGTEKQRELIRPTLRAEIIWCIGMSEPNAGSDLGSLTTRAEVHDDHFVVNGQKVWTSSGLYADLCFCYVRTDPKAPKHKGISVLIIDMRTPGVDPRPLRQINGSVEFAEVFFNDVVVPRDNLVGSLNDGWRVTQISLAHERGGLWTQDVASAQKKVQSLIALAKTTGADADPTVRRRLAGAYAKTASLRALGYKGLASLLRTSANPEHSLLKLSASEMTLELDALGMEILGPFGAMTDEAHEDGRWPMGFLTRFSATIAAGTSEIQRNIIAQRILGLPRE